MEKGSHSILMVQTDRDLSTRTWFDYESVTECMEGICKMYEDYLKQKHHNRGTITYDISELFEYIDAMNDMSCLVYHGDTHRYAPYSKYWIKERIYILLRNQAIPSN